MSGDVGMDSEVSGYIQRHLEVLDNSVTKIIV